MELANINIEFAEQQDMFCILAASLTSSCCLIEINIITKYKNL
jgi:hypothetical protein